MERYIIKNVNIWDGTRNMECLEGYDIAVQDGIIAEVGRNLDASGRVMDQKGAYVVPGLINMHVHLPGSGKIGKKNVSELSGLIRFIKSNPVTREVGIAITAAGAKTELLSGVTTVRAVGGVGDMDSRLAKRIAAGKRVGARIVAANEAICTPGGHMEGTVSVAADSVEKAVKLVEDAKRSGAAFVKLMITGGVLDCKKKGHPGELKMPAEMVKACCDRAHALGLKVAAHVEGPEGMEIAALGGVDTIEHGAVASEQALEAMRERDAALICTLSPAIPLYMIDPRVTGYGEDCQYNTGVLLEGMKEVLEACLTRGILVGLGTDTGCPYVTHYDMWRELVYFAKYIRGVDAKFALHTATAVNAKILGLYDEIGTIEVGKRADLLFVKSDPLKDLRALREPLMVMTGGKIHTQKNKKLPDVEKALDRLLEA